MGDRAFDIRPATGGDNTPPGPFGWHRSALRPEPRPESGVDHAIARSDLNMLVGKGRLRVDEAE